MNCVLLFYHKFWLNKSNIIYIFLSFTLVYFELLRVNVPIYTSHLFYVSSLVIYFFHIYLLLKSSYNFKGAFFPTYIKYILRSSLIIALVSLYTKPFINPGWVWPVNIALQEIVLISLFFSEVISFGFRKSRVNFILFVLLLLFRDSGKASLISLFVFAGINFLIQESNRIKKINFLFKCVWFSHIFIITLAILFLNFVKSLDKGSVVRYVLLKRFIYIEEAINYLSNGVFLFIGGGFGPENYFVTAVNLTMKNAPQLLPLTIIVFGGLISYFFYFYSVSLFFKSFVSDKKLDFYFKSYILSLLIVMSFHEYFVNPLVYFGVGLVLVSYKSKLLNNEI